MKENAGTNFIACHFANCSLELSIIGGLLETYDHLYAETVPVPRYTKAFYEKFQDELIYGTDMVLNLQCMKPH